MILFILFCLSSGVFGFTIPPDYCDLALHHIALATIAVGWKAQSFAELLILSYARNGKLNAPLYIITENAKPYTDFIQSKEELVLLKDRFVIVEQSSLAKLPTRLSEVEWNSFHAQAPLDTLYRNPGMAVRFVKSQLLDLLPSKHEYVLYVDSDMVVGTALGPMLCASLRAYIDPKLPFDSAPTTSGVLAVFPYISEGHAENAVYHGGIFLVSRTNSVEMLHEWGEQIRLGGFEHDQHALVVAVNKLNVAPKVYLLPSEGPRQHYYTFIEPSAFVEPPYALIHTTVPRLLKPSRWNFTLSMARHYYQRILRIPFQYDFLQSLPNRWKSAAAFVLDMKKAFLTPADDRKFAKSRERALRLEYDLLGDPADLGAVNITNHEMDEKHEQELQRLKEERNETETTNNSGSIPKLRVWRLLRHGKRSEQLANLTRWLDHVLELSQTFRWNCGHDGDAKRGLLGFVTDYAKQHAHGHVKFGTPPDLPAGYQCLYDQHLPGCERGTRDDAENATSGGSRRALSWIGFALMMAIKLSAR